MPTRIAMLASGSGSNVENFVGYFDNHPSVEIVLVVCDRPGAYVLDRAGRLGIPSELIPGPGWQEPAPIIQKLRARKIDFLVLAGFLRLVPPGILRKYPDRILNIHPALLPAFGGKGMYGMHVHRAVIASGARESGVSIHLVNERYDEGRILFQARVDIAPDDSPESLAEKVHVLEYAHYPRVVEQYIQGISSPAGTGP